MPFPEELAERKGEGWLTAITHAHQILSGGQGLQNQEFAELIEACRAPEQLSLLTREFFRFSQKDPQKRSGYRVFIKEVDDSDYSLTDWIEAFDVIFLWLAQKKKGCDFLNVLHYMNCCSQTPDNHLFHHELAGIVRQMLNEHGMELAWDITTN